MEMQGCYSFFLFYISFLLFLTDSQVPDCLSDCRIILHDLLPPPSTASQHYELIHCTHALQLPEHSTLFQIASFLHACYIKTLISYLDNLLIMP